MIKCISEPAGIFNNKLSIILNIVTNKMSFTYESKLPTHTHFSGDIPGILDISAKKYSESPGKRSKGKAKADDKQQT